METAMASAIRLKMTLMVEIAAPTLSTIIHATMTIVDAIASPKINNMKQLRHQLKLCIPLLYPPQLILMVLVFNALTLSLVKSHLPQYAEDQGIPAFPEGVVI